MTVYTLNQLRIYWNEVVNYFEGLCNTVWKSLLLSTILGIYTQGMLEFEK